VSVNLHDHCWVKQATDSQVINVLTLRERHLLASLAEGFLIANTADLAPRIVYKLMGDPRNVAHAKKVVQEKHHKDKQAPKATGRVPRPGGKAQPAEEKKGDAEEGAVPKAAAAAKPPEQPPDSTQSEKSLAVLSTLKDLEFHSRANIEKLAELSLTIEEELKQKTFAEAIGDVYSAQDAFQSKILKLIEDYEAECARLKPA
jgi:hypothetical protein